MSRSRLSHWVWETFGGRARRAPAPRGRKIFVVPPPREEGALCRGGVERGVHGIVLEAASPAGMRRLASAARIDAGGVPLVAARVTEITSLGIGDRVCVGTSSVIEGETGGVGGD